MDYNKKINYTRNEFSIPQRWQMVATHNLNMMGRNYKNCQKFESYLRLFERSLDGLRKYDPEEADDLSNSYQLALRSKQRAEERRRMLEDHGLKSSLYKLPENLECDDIFPEIDIPPLTPESNNSFQFAHEH